MSTSSHLAAAELRQARVRSRLRALTTGIIVAAFVIGGIRYSIDGTYGAVNLILPLVAVAALYGYWGAPMILERSQWADERFTAAIEDQMAAAIAAAQAENE